MRGKCARDGIFQSPFFSPAARQGKVPAANLRHKTPYETRNHQNSRKVDLFRSAQDLAKQFAIRFFRRTGREAQKSAGGGAPERGLSRGTFLEGHKEIVAFAKITKRVNLGMFQRSTERRRRGPSLPLRRVRLHFFHIRISRRRRRRVQGNPERPRKRLGRVRKMHLHMRKSEFLRQELGD